MCDPLKRVPGMVLETKVAEARGGHAGPVKGIWGDLGRASTAPLHQVIITEMVWHKVREKMDLSLLLGYEPREI